MASFGAKYPFLSKVKEEPKGALPTYEAAPVRIGRLVKADLAVQLASGKLYADDALAESVDEFVSASIEMETDDMTDDIAAVVYGTTVKDKTVIYNAGDEPPAGGLGYLKRLMRNKKVICKAYYYPSVKAALGNDTAQTKTDSITFGTNKTTFTVFACNNGDWRHTEEFETESAAVAWLQEKLSPVTPAASGDEGNA